MFKIEDLYVEDRKLGDLLKAVAGIARGIPRAVPVMNIENDLKASADGSLAEVFAHHLTKSKTQTFTPKDVQNWLAKHGKSRQSSSYVLKFLRDSGMVRKTGQSSATVYHVKAKP